MDPAGWSATATFQRPCSLPIRLFCRPLAGLAAPQRCHLHLLGVDLARSPDGRWWVLADRTQSPSGTGYALQNRTIVADALPEAFRTANVRRLASFFRAQREVLLGLAQCDHPRAVLLTPGPYNETYFEHSYLARYLGFTLAEGADLTVRDRRVYLKTVEGLQPVHVILRRVDDSFCDPLELRSDSFLGVAGLVDAVNAGNVVVANALGSGVIETAAIMPFLPGLARKLLGEPLKLPSVATWWCGQDYALDWVLNHLDQCRGQTGVPVACNGARLRRRPVKCRKAENQRTDTRSPLRIRGAGAGRPLDRAGVGPGPHVSAQPGACGRTF